MTTATLHASTRKDLAAIAREHAVAGWHGMRKGELIEALMDVFDDSSKNRLPVEKGRGEERVRRRARRPPVPEGRRRRQARRPAADPPAGRGRQPRPRLPPAPPRRPHPPPLPRTCRPPRPRRRRTTR